MVTIYILFSMLDFIYINIVLYSVQYVIGIVTYMLINMCVHYTYILYCNIIIIIIMDPRGSLLFFCFFLYIFYNFSDTHRYR